MPLRTKGNSGRWVHLVYELSCKHHIARSSSQLHTSPSIEKEHCEPFGYYIHCVCGRFRSLKGGTLVSIFVCETFPNGCYARESNALQFHCETLFQHEVYEGRSGNIGFPRSQARWWIRKYPLRKPADRLVSGSACLVTSNIAVVLE